MSPVVLHVSPHPDDELIGAPATLMALRDAGWRVVNLAWGLGGEEASRPIRRAELEEACRRAGFELRLPADLASASGPARRDEVQTLIGELAPEVVVSPGPEDRHPTHLEVAAAVAAARPRRWWQWALWGSLPEPTLAVGFDEARLGEILAALSAHRSQLERNDFRRLVHGRAEAAAVLAPELIGGFGAAGTAPPYAELLSEWIDDGEGPRLGRRRWPADAAFAGEGGADGAAVGEAEAAAGE